MDAPLKKQTNHSETHFGRHASYHFCCAIRGRGNSLAACGHVLAPLCLCSIGAPWCLNDLDLATVIPGHPMKYHSNLLTPINVILRFHRLHWNSFFLNTMNIFVRAWSLILWAWEYHGVSQCHVGMGKNSRLWRLHSNQPIFWKCTHVNAIKWVPIRICLKTYRPAWKSCDVYITVFSIRLPLFQTSPYHTSPTNWGLFLEPLP